MDSVDAILSSGPMRAAIQAGDRGAIVRLARLSMGWTQSELGSRCGYAASTISRLETGGQELSNIDMLRRLSDILAIPPRLLDLASGAELRLSGCRGIQAGAASQVPAQLPADVLGFAGRCRELAQLDALLDSPRTQPAAVVISAVSGTAGVGKTALAVHWAHQVVRRFPDGQLYANLRGFDPSGQPKHPTDAVRGFLHSLGVPPERIPDDVDAQAGMYRSLLAGKRVLVLLDNARDSEQVRPLLPGSSGCLVVVTSRSQLAGLVAVEGAHGLTLDLLTFDEAQQLLAGRLGQERVSEEHRAVEQIICMCARLPLALAIVAARAARHRNWPMSALAAELDTARGLLEALSAGESAIDLRALFSWSYKTLSADAARLFGLLSLHPGPDISATAAASLADITAPEARRLLSELARAHLIEEDKLGRFAFHDLLRKYSGELVHDHETEVDRRAATQRMFDHYLHTLAFSQLGEPFRREFKLDAPRLGLAIDVFADHEQAVTWFTTELPVLLPIVKLAAAQGLDRYVCQLARVLGPFFDFCGHWHEWIAALRVALDAANRLADQHEQANAYRDLAAANLLLGRYEDADTYLRHAFDRRVGTASRAHAHQVLGWLLERQEHYVEAVDQARHALDLYGAAGDSCGQAHALNDIGFQRALLGSHQGALASCRKALDLAEDVGHRYVQAASWRSLGYAHHHLGEHERACECYQRAIELLRRIGDRREQAEVLHMLGDTFAVAGQPNQARPTWLRALCVFEELTHSDAEKVRAKLANIGKPTTSQVERGTGQNT